MSTVAAATTELEPRPGGSLVRSELRRLRHRRFILWIVLIGTVLYLGILAISWTQYAKTTPEELARAQESMQQIIDDQNAYLRDCIQQLPAGEDPEFSCGVPMTMQDLGDPEGYLQRQPFTMDSELPAFSLGMAALVSCIAFLVGATWIGAEWSQKTLMALLFWEPRRMKVFATKVGVLLGALVGLGVVSQALLVPVGLLFARVKGTSKVGAGFWGDLIAQQARCVLLVALVGLIGFGIANLVRNTGAALGAGFVYFVAEIVAQVVRPMWQPWFLTTNAGALVTDGGLTVSWSTGQPTVGPDGSLGDSKTYLMTNLHGGLVLGTVVLVLLVLGAWTFKRRDLT